MGKTRLIAETGAGQHGVATAIVGAALGLPVRGLHGRGRRRAPAPERLPHGAAWARRSSRSRPGRRTLKDAINEALRDWVGSSATTHYLLGTAAGPHPYPTMVRDFQPVIGTETRTPVPRGRGTAARPPGRLRRRRVERDRDVRTRSRTTRRSGWSGSRPAARGSRPASTARPSRPVPPGVLHGTLSLPAPGRGGPGRRDATRSPRGSITPASAPSTPTYNETGRVGYHGRHRRGGSRRPSRISARAEGIIPALESAHAVAEARRRAGTLDRDEIMVITHLGAWRQGHARPCATARGGRVSRLASGFSDRSRTALVAFTVAGDPDPERSMRIAATILPSGADVLELGMPFSDPTGGRTGDPEGGRPGARGGRDPRRALRLGPAASGPSAPMRQSSSSATSTCSTATGSTASATTAAEAGLDGILCVDLPVEQSGGTPARPAGRRAWTGS